jgi:hypothetical protein
MLPFSFKIMVGNGSGGAASERRTTIPIRMGDDPNNGWKEVPIVTMHHPGPTRSAQSTGAGATFTMVRLPNR